MDKKDEIISMQLDLIRSMTENNMRRIGTDFWGNGRAEKTTPAAKSDAAPGKIASQSRMSWIFTRASIRQDAPTANEEPTESRRRICVCSSFFFWKPVNLCWIFTSDSRRLLSLL